MPVQQVINTGLPMSTMVPNNLQPSIQNGPPTGYDFSGYPVDQNLGVCGMSWSIDTRPKDFSFQDMSGMNQIDFGGSFLGTQFVEGFMYVAVVGSGHR